MPSYTPATWRRMRQYIEYVPHAGELRWKIRINSRCRIGSTVGYKDPDRHYRYFRFNNKKYFVHRLIWVIENNRPVPIGYVVDHKDGDVVNNHISNLRIASPAQNSLNKVKVSTKNGTGFPWVSRYTSTSGEIRYRYAIRLKGVETSKRGFRNPVEAYHAVKIIADQLFGEFAPQHKLPQIPSVEYSWFLTMLSLRGDENKKLERFHRCWLCWHYADN